MPAISSVVLTDGTTPITLSPVGGNNEAGQTRYRTTDGATALANSEALFSNKVNATSKTQRQYLRYNQPITAVSTDTGETLVRSNITIEMNVVMPPDVTPADRALAVKRFFSAADAAAFGTELTTGEGQW